jgi:glutathione S-transferase
MTLRLHDYDASGNCYKVRLLLAQLGRDYERVPVDVFAGDTLTGDYARLNPQRQTPVLEADGAEPLTESNAILVHLAESTEYLPENANDRAQALRWLFFEQTEVIQGIAGLRFRLVTQRIRPDGREALWRRSVGEAALKVLGGRLGAGEWLAGPAYSVADIAPTRTCTWLTKPGST